MIDEALVRREKLAKLQALGVDAYPSATTRDTSCEEALTHFDVWAESKKEITLAGRLMTTRLHGGILFADLMDGTGKIQILLKEDEMDQKLFETFRDLIDPADIVEARGVLFQTKRGEKTLAVSRWNILVKALLPLPEKWHGLQDVEARYRQRELDVLTNPDTRQKFLTRSKLVSTLRRFLDERSFIEFETPILQPIPGGANARPFATHHNALDIDLYLRIAPELYLKRLLVGGFEKIYEIGRCFRNEGIDYAHNPEFSMLELYWAYTSREVFLDFLEDMVKRMVKDTIGSDVIERKAGKFLDFAGTWKRITFRQAVLDACGIDIDLIKTPEALMEEVKRKAIRLSFDGCVGMGEYYDVLYKKTARPLLGIEDEKTVPVWVTEYPADLKPLANTATDDKTKSSTAQLVIHGAEVVNAFYFELNDPILQRERLEEQERLAGKGSEEAQRMDEGFLAALEHGMPPAAGMGMGIDRLAALLTDSDSLKEIILFPTLRPEQSSGGQDHGPGA